MADEKSRAFDETFKRATTGNDAEDARNALDQLREMQGNPTSLMSKGHATYDNLVKEGEDARAVPRLQRTPRHRKAITRYLSTFGATDEGWQAELGAATGTPARSSR